MDSKTVSLSPTKSCKFESYILKTLAASSDLKWMADSPIMKTVI